MQKPATLFCTLALLCASFSVWGGNAGATFAATTRESENDQVFEFKSAAAAKRYVAHHRQSTLVGANFVRIPIFIEGTLPTVDLLRDVRPETPVQMHAFTDDPLSDSQWALASSTSWGIGIDGALTHSSSQIYSPRIAILDTGWTVHPDGVEPVDQYDFITDQSTATDGSGRDSDATDTGDWCPSEAEDSSWHGTAVAGVISAVSDNGVGLRGMDTNGEIIHARVLGACGGTDTDIADAIRWSAGGSVSGVASITKVDVINLSLGGIGVCNSYLQAAINYAVEQGTVVVVAAGNSNQNAGSYSPANCSGTITVGASNDAGKLTAYSNYGSVVALLAPGGESLNAIKVLGNTGSTTTLAAAYLNYSGTSFSAPYVSGAVAWLRSIRPNLSPSEIRVALRATAKPIPSGSRCSVSILCGSGILNLPAALSFVEGAQTYPDAPVQTAITKKTSSTVDGKDWSQRQWCGLCTPSYYYSGTGLNFYSDYICYTSYYSWWWGWQYSYVDCYQEFNWKVIAPAGSNVLLSATITGRRLCLYEDGNYAGVAVDSDNDGYALEWYSSYTKITSSSCFQDGKWVLNEGDVSGAISNGQLAYKIRTVEQNYGIYNDGADDEAAISVTSIKFNFTSREYTPTWTEPPTFSTTQPLVGESMWSSTGDWGQGATFGYQWLRCTDNTQTSSCKNITNATEASYEPTRADAGGYLRLKVTAENTAGSAIWKSGPTLAVGAASALTAVPVIPASPTVNSSFTGTIPSAAGTPAPAITPQWYRCDFSDTRTSADALADSGCTAIDGATSATYTPAWEDAGKYLRLAVIASNTFGSTQRVSQTSSSAVVGRPTLTEAPAISGTPSAAVELVAGVGTWRGYPSPTTAYSWFSCTTAGVAATTLPADCKAISGATSSAYAPGATLAGKYLRVRVTATNSVGSTVSFSATTDRVTLAPSLTAAPTITGTAKVGSNLTVGTGTWSGFPLPTYTYIWYRCTSTGAATSTEPSDCTAIEGAIEATYAAGVDDYGNFLRIKVTAGNSLNTADAYSASTSVVGGAKPFLTSVPTVTGTPIAHGTLMATDGIWTSIPGLTTTAYSWFSCTTAGVAATTLPADCKAISGATSSAYAPGATLAGKYLRVRVTATNSVGSTVSFSATTDRVTLAPSLTAAPTITGTAKVGSNLTVGTGTWSGFPLPTYTYIWYRCTSTGAATSTEPSDCTAIEGAIKNKYKASSLDTSMHIRVSVTATSSSGVFSVWSKSTGLIK